MKAWHWVLIAAVLVVGFVVVNEATKPKSGAVNPTVAAANGLGGIAASLGGILTKVNAPSAGAYPPGATGASPDYNGLSASSYGSQYAAAMQSTGEVASRSAGSGGATAGGGLTNAQDPLGVGTLTAPDFTVGVNGADFSA